MTVEFGWFIPTMGDTSQHGVAEAAIPQSMELFTNVAQTAEDAGFEYILVPVQTNCYDAYITCAMVAARTKKIAPLVAARGGFMAPTVMAKMISTFDQLTQGRVRINLITGGSSVEMAADGMFHDHDQRYAVLTESLEVMKKAWTETEPFDVDGTFFKANGVNVLPKPYQAPYPPVYLGGLSPAAKDLCAKHADVHLFWGDTPDNIAKLVAEMDERAAAEGRSLRYGMRLHVVVRETESEAWNAAHAIIANAANGPSETSVKWDQSMANLRMKELAKAENHLIADHLWSGIASVREGSGVAIVGNPEQVAATIREFMDAGCSSFCLSGYPHADEAERFGRLVMPLFADELASRDVELVSS
ncbi:LLM class flavin-dependent oxidoreductase [Streptomyces sp. SID10853]|uniref:LLM class flavin-dependent oxidoreductase n=1 Tax=Streptomyces sp. SID10853 TaxID=2706028 RepID=UPI0013C1616B|nr:LLM class flavin-dependent oxidoreductase [Streptomyces sp. SID10853]NDZ80933.1 LLM class flavin-dependent oxidoreductase [Streptomyces sp. SID10853]